MRFSRPSGKIVPWLLTVSDLFPSTCSPNPVQIQTNTVKSTASFYRHNGNKAYVN